jgi:hypothetical protein
VGTAETNEVHRCILLLNRLFDRGDPEVVENELLPDCCGWRTNSKSAGRGAWPRGRLVNQPD